MESQHVLIIGAGLAGTSLAHQLLAKGHRVQLIDRGTNHSTAVAAGMVNPMVFRRMNKSWRLDEFISEARNFYLQLEQTVQDKWPRQCQAANPKKVQEPLSTMTP